MYNDPETDSSDDTPDDTAPDNGINPDVNHVHITHIDVGPQDWVNDLPYRD